MRRWLIAWLLCLPPLLAQAEVAVPPLDARVTDLTGTLTAEQRTSLEARLQQFEAQKGSQIAVLMVPTTQPEDIAQYSIRVVEQWKLGRKKVDDGVLLIVAKDDRKLRIEVGYGLEGALPDVIAKRIVSDDIAPHFKQGDFYGGIVAGVTRIMAVVQGEALPAPQAHSSPPSNLEEEIAFLFFAAMIGGSVLRKWLGELFGSLVAGGLIGGIVILLGGVLVAAVFAGLAAFVINIFMGMRTVNRWNGDYRGGSWGGNSWGGGSWSGGDSGGFSGGGGGFGGGGASGDW